MGYIEAKGPFRRAADGGWQDLAERVEACTVPRKQLHEYDWELRKRSEEIAELQKALSDSQAYIFEERGRLLGAHAENDELRAGEARDAARIRYLLAELHPFLPHVTLRYLSKDAQYLPQPPRSPSRAQSPGRCSHEAVPGGGQGQQLDRAGAKAGCLADNADQDYLRVRLDALQAQLAEQKDFAAERVSALLEDRRMREEDAAAHKAVALQRHDALLERLHRAEAAWQQATKDYILVKRERNEAAARGARTGAVLRAAGARADAELAAARAELAGRLADARGAAEARVEAHTERYRAQVLEREQEVAELQAAASASRAALEARLRSAEGRLVREGNRCRQLEARRLLDVEGWAADIAMLRQQVAAADRKVTQLNLVNRLPDDERLDALLHGLEQRHPDCASACAGCAPEDNNEECGAQHGGGTPRSCRAAPRHAQQRNPIGHPLAVVGCELARARAGVAALERRLRSVQACA